VQLKVTLPFLYQCTYGDLSESSLTDFVTASSSTAASNMASFPVDWRSRLSPLRYDTPTKKIISSLKTLEIKLTKKRTPLAEQLFICYNLQRFAHLETFSLKFLSSSFVIRVNLLHPSDPTLFLSGLLLSLWCF